MYDTNNIFAKILRKEISCKKIEENEYFLSFHDLHPKAPSHALIIPKGSYVNAHDFTNRASPQEIIGFWKGVNTTISSLDLDKNGYRLIANTGIHARQEVSHFHVHLLGGNDLGSKMVMS